MGTQAAGEIAAYLRVTMWWVHLCLYRCTCRHIKPHSSRSSIDVEKCRQIRLFVREADLHHFHVNREILHSELFTPVFLRTFFQADTALLTEQQAAHKLYSEERWALLVPEDVEVIRKRGWKASYVGGVGGIVNPYNIKCMHCHFAHYLATGSNVVGRWTQEALDARMHLPADAT